MQILPGVYLVNGSPYGRHQNGYLVHSAGTTVLIDSGDLHAAETLPEVERNAARWGFRLEHMKTVQRELHVAFSPRVQPWWFWVIKWSVIITTIVRYR